MNITIRKEKRPVYLQIYKQMRNNILDGIFPFGSKLPSKRLLAAELHVVSLPLSTPMRFCATKVMRNPASAAATS